MRRVPAIVRAVWADAQSVTEWTPIKELEERTTQPIIDSVGFLVLDQPDRVCLAVSVDTENDDASDVLTIPRAMLVDKLVVLVPEQEIDS